MDKQPEEKEIDFYYEIDPAYRIIAANTVLTTIAGNDQIKIDFAVESLGIPQRIRHKMLPGRISGQMVDTDPKEKYVRNVQVGILLTFERAEIIADFIKQQIALARKPEQK